MALTVSATFIKEQMSLKWPNKAAGCIVSCFFFFFSWNNLDFPSLQQVLLRSALCHQTVNDGGKESGTEHCIIPTELFRNFKPVITFQLFHASNGFWKFGAKIPEIKKKNALIKRTCEGQYALQYPTLTVVVRTTTFQLNPTAEYHLLAACGT